MIKQGLRRVFGPPMRGISKTGRIVQTLWDAAQIQDQQGDYQRKIGEIAMQLIEQGQLRNAQIEKLLARMKRNESMLSRLESFLEHQVRLTKTMRAGQDPNVDGDEVTEDELDAAEAAEVAAIEASEKLAQDTNDDRLAPV